MTVTLRSPHLISAMNVIGLVLVITTFVAIYAQ